MKTLPLASFAVTALAAAFAMPYAPRVEAGTGIQRCQADDGAVVYTDRACGALGAQRTVIAGELLGRIARDERSNGVDAATAEIGTSMHASATASMPPAGRRSLGAGCAKSPTQLSMDLQGALALGDINRIAESYHWAGMSHDAGQRVMARLDAMPKQGLSHVQYFDATIGGGAMEFADASQSLDEASSAGGVLQLSFGDRVVDFDVERFQGCYFVRF